MHNQGVVVEQIQTRTSCSTRREEYTVSLLDVGGPACRRVRGLTLRFK